MTSRGKYARRSSALFATRLFDTAESPLAKKPHGTSAASVNRAYGLPAEGRCARRPKTMVKIPIVASGWTSAQSTPTRVCL